jgi:hypothetical protein
LVARENISVCEAARVIPFKTGEAGGADLAAAAGNGAAGRATACIAGATAGAAVGETDVAGPDAIARRAGNGCAGVAAIGFALAAGPAAGAGDSRVG